MFDVWWITIFLKEILVCPKIQDIPKWQLKYSKNNHKESI